ncbi:type II toxin-antitoxin system RelE/ParE family toxin [Plebeiibacterium marinum]|uniref:type II toxin-antitoxin system RelE/ParE family toxin n=1 Tax=Plebeiibacterium marinum TaxID=2992111 RepID=UPI00342D5DEF
MVENFDLARKVDYIRSGYRLTKVKSHLIFLKQSENHIIEVVRILHQKMNIENRLKE